MGCQGWKDSVWIFQVTGVTLHEGVLGSSPYAHNTVNCAA